METVPEAAGPGTVVLDIGGNIGAIVLSAPADLDGHEIEITPAGQQWSGRHVAFHWRATADGRVLAAVFPKIAAGDWQVRLLGDDSSPVVAIEVEGARVASAAYPG